MWNWNCSKAEMRAEEVFVPVPPLAADLPVVRRALDAGTAERHLLAERLFKSVCDRGLDAEIYVYLNSNLEHIFF